MKASAPLPTGRRAAARVLRPDVRRILGWAGVAVAFYVAVRYPVQLIQGETEFHKNDISRIEAGFARLHRSFPARQRVGWLVPRGAPAVLGTFQVVAQYALLPRRLEVVSAADCAERGRDACGAAALDMLIVTDLRGGAAADEAVALGFSPPAAPGAGMYVARRVR